jgi:hypothetical protein
LIFANLNIWLLIFVKFNYILILFQNL